MSGPRHRQRARPATPSSTSAAAAPTSRAGVGVPLAVLGTAVVVAAVVAPIRTHTWAATAVTVAIGLVAVALAVPGRPGRAPARPGARSAAPWFVLAGVVLVLELGALAYGDRPAFPTISYLVGPEFVDPAVRFAGYVVWICGGYWLVRR